MSGRSDSGAWDCIVVGAGPAGLQALVPTAAGSGVTAAVAINVRLSLEDADRSVAHAQVGSGVRER